MKKFEFYDYFYDAVSGLTTEQKGQVLDIICEWAFSNNPKKHDVDDIVKAVCKILLRQIPKAKLDFEQMKALSKEVLEYCKSNDLILCVKAGLSNDEIENICKELSHIPKDIVLKQLEWIKTTYKDNFYFTN